ncbi:MAG: hypothetical protein AB1349_14215 [Elusimicrobiota bacterium]
MRRKIFAVLLAIVIFLVGTIFGILVDRITIMKMLHFPLPGVSLGPHHQKMPQRVIDKVARQLELSDEQKEKLVNILEKNKESIDKLFIEIEPKLQKRFGSMCDEIKTILNEKQKQKFEQMAEKFKKFGPPPPLP